MKDLFLIPIILAAFAFGYYIMVKVDRFIEDNQRLIAEENRNNQNKIRIAAETPMLLDAVAPALETCSESDPCLGFFLSSGRSARLLEKLEEDQVDIVLLNDAPALADSQYAVLPIFCENTAAPASCFGLPVENLDEETRIHLIWKKNRESKILDRVIFALENEHCRLKHGYADYLD